MENSVNERINFLVVHFEGGRQNKFAEKIGVSATTINGIVGIRQATPGYDILYKILNSYPVSSDWLLLGLGDMERENEPVHVKEGDPVLQLLKGQLQEKDAQIRMLHEMLGKPSVRAEQANVPLFMLNM